MTKPSNAIEIENLSKRYRLGEQSKPYGRLSESLSEAARRLFSRERSTGEDLWIWALRDVSFEVQRGEVLGLIGRNGAGKSTLLKILSRITRPTEGRAVLNGRVGSLLEVGTGFHPELTGRENILLNGAILGMTRSEIETSIDDIVEFAELNRFIGTPVKRYSSGMYVRLAFAVAAHLRTEILLVDEVLSVGDAAFQRKCLGKIGDLTTEEGRTVVFVSHDLGAVQRLCDRAVLIDDGTIRTEGRPRDVVERYLSESIGASGGTEGPGYRVDASRLETERSDGFRFTRVQMQNPENPRLGPATGDPLVFELGYEASRTYLEPGFVIRVKEALGTEVLRLSTMPISGYRLDKVERSGRVRLRLHELPLAAGRYYLDVGFTRANVEHILDVELVVEFDVQARDVYGSGFPIERTHGLVVTGHEWHHEHES